MVTLCPLLVIVKISGLSIGAYEGGPIPNLKPGPEEALLSQQINTSR